MDALLHHHPALAIALTVAIVLTAGVVAQVLARRLAVPAILFLLGFGILLGPEVAGIVRPEIFGVGLRALISLAVAIIVFEGAMMIDIRQLRHCSRSVLGLITTGALTTFLLAGAIAHYLIGLPWKIGLLYGAIVSVTGPTVIGPILKRLPLNHRLKTTLEAESVLVDAVGVLLTASVFSFITASNLGIAGGVIQLLSNLAIGTVIGAATAFGLKLALSKSGILPADLVRLMVLAAVLLAYSISQAFAHESGIAAVAVAGLIVGSMKLPYEETVKQFKNDLTLIALALVFILLAASMQVDHLAALGWPGVVTVLLLLFVVRPIAVALSTWGTALEWREKAFIAWMGPRGIVAASMASLMALELKAWDIQGGSPIAPLVFLTVLISVTIEGSGAGLVARLLKVMPKKILVIGGDEIARRLAKQLSDEGEAVTLIDRDPDSIRLALDAGLNALQADATEPGVLSDAGIDWCRTIVAATPSDKSNLMVCQIAKKHPDVRQVARVNDPKNEEAFREAGIETLTIADATALSLSTLVTRPTALPLLGRSSYGDKIIEVRIGNARFDEQPLNKLDMPKECLVALVKRGGDVTIPNGRTVLKLGDTVTLIGLKEAVDQMRTLFESDV